MCIRDRTKFIQEIFEEPNFDSGDKTLLLICEEGEELSLIHILPIATSPILPGVLDMDEIAWLNDYHRQVFAKLAPHLNGEERSWLAERCV